MVTFVTPTAQDTLERVGKSTIITDSGSVGQVAVRVAKVKVDPTAMVTATAQEVTAESVIYPTQEYKRHTREMATGIANPEDNDGLGYDYSSVDLEETEV